MGRSGSRRWNTRHETRTTPRYSPISTPNSTACCSAFHRVSSGNVKNIPTARYCLARVSERSVRDTQQQGRLAWALAPAPLCSRNHYRKRRKVTTDEASRLAARGKRHNGGTSRSRATEGHAGDQLPRQYLARPVCNEHGRIP